VKIQQALKCIATLLSTICFKMPCLMSEQLSLSRVQTVVELKLIDRLRDMLNAPWLLTNRQFQWTGNGHSQLHLAELSKPSPNIDLLRTTDSNGRAIVHCFTLTYNPRLAKVKVNPHAKNQRQRSNGSNRRTQTNRRTNTRMLPNVLSPQLRGW